jgi:hypothetical protein
MKRPDIWRLGRVALTLSILLGGLVACGSEEDEPTPTSTVPATAVATLPLGDVSPVSGTGLTVGALADRIGAAWPGVTSYRAVTTTGVAGVGTPRPGTAPATAGAVAERIDEIVLPDRKRRVARTNGVLQYELISVGGKLYARGPAAPGLDPLRSDTVTWVEIDPALLTPGASDFVEDYAGFVAPVSAPYSGLAPEERDRDATSQGETTIDGHPCQVYRFADTTYTGERIEIILSLGADDLPCAIETRVGGLATTTVFTYNIPLTIEAPLAASPVPSDT